MLSPFGGLKKVFGGVNKAVKKVGGGAVNTVTKVAKAVTPDIKKKKTAIGPPAPKGGSMNSKINSGAPSRSVSRNG